MPNFETAIALRLDESEDQNRCNHHKREDCEKNIEQVDYRNVVDIILHLTPPEPFGGMNPSR